MPGLTAAQLETIIMAHDGHGRDLPGRFTIDGDQTLLMRSDDDPDAQVYRLGYFLGDGTGCAYLLAAEQRVSMPRSWDKCPDDGRPRR